MRDDYEAILGIIDELLSSAIRTGARRVSIVYEDLGPEIQVEVVDNGPGFDEREKVRIREALNQPRRTEIEEYYGHLAGEWMAGMGLNLVGMMVDRAEIDSKPGQGTRIAVVRKKES